MKIGILGFNISSGDKVQMNRILVGYGLLEKNTIEINDVKSVSIESAMEDKDIILSFGSWASRMGRKAAKKKNITFVELPDIKKLYRPLEGGSKGAREKAAEVLNGLKSVMGSGTLKIVDDQRVVETISPRDVVANLSVGMIQELKKKVQDSGKEEWICSTESGHLVRVSLEPTDIDPSFDINVTFEELLVLRALLDVFQASEVRFVPKDTINHQSHSNNSS